MIPLYDKAMAAASLMFAAFFGIDVGFRQQHGRLSVQACHCEVVMCRQ